ncbi:MAG: acyl-CoA dehydrogenase family protein [Alphaproteobacteria bacterium]|nr:acyl-CoA dehydrogenase family protein [Alphaproteobacteria bacterium]MBV9551378.1 acyl-CoA dehydrogenase family protein [Alphaproteobacteria bacterium]
MDTIVSDARLPADIDAQPVVQAAKAIRPTLRRYKDEIEREQRMPPALAEEMREAGFYRLLIPRAYGGLESDPLTYLRVGELLAEGCGSVGWNIANNSIGQLVVLGLPQEGTDEIYGKGPVNLAGTAVQGGGKGVRVDGGYRVTGRWQFGSGINEAVWLLGSFQIIENGEPVERPDGSGSYWRAVFRRSEAEIVPGTWEVSGLRGTGSFDWTVTDAFLPERRVMVHAGAPLDNQWNRWPSTTYQLPAQCWVGPHHSSVITGLARAGIDALIELAGGKQPRGRPAGLLCDNPQVQDAVGRADAILNAGRAYRTAMITELWNTVAAGDETTLEQRARCRLAATYAADSAREAMDLMYRAGGSTSFKRESRLAECWRDLHTVGQTVTLAPEWYPIGGRVYLGVDPGSRMR